MQNLKMCRGGVVRAATLQLEVPRFKAGLARGTFPLWTLQVLA